MKKILLIEDDLDLYQSTYAQELSRNGPPE